MKAEMRDGRTTNIEIESLLELRVLVLELQEVAGEGKEYASTYPALQFLLEYLIPIDTYSVIRSGKE